MNPCFHRVTWTGAIWLSLVASIVAQDPATYQFGSVAIKVPAPGGYVAMPSDESAALSSALAGGGEMIARFVPATRSSAQELASFAILATASGVRAVDFGSDDFTAMTAKVKSGLDETLRRLAPDITALGAEVSKRIQQDFSIRQPVIAGLFDDAPDRLGVLIVMPLSVGGNTLTMLSANSLVRVRNRLLFMYVYTPNVPPDAVKSLVWVARAWTDAIQAANAAAPSDGPR